jgi:hypothetical protein
MSSTISYNTEHGIVESVLADDVTKEDLRLHEVRCMDLAQERNTTLFLTDATRATLKVSVVDLYDLPGLYEKYGLERPVRIAVLEPTSEAGKGLVDFYETVCVNRGWHSKVFTTRQEAVDWLLAQ